MQIPQVQDFTGGAEVMDDGMGGAIVQALMGGDEQSVRVEAEV